MTRSSRWLVLIAITMYCAAILPIDAPVTIDTPEMNIKRGTYLTFRRYYFISRLEKTMRLLFKIQSAHHQPFHIMRSDPFDISIFQDKRIIRSLKRIEELRNLKPLFMIWDDFVAYKSLEDDVFIEDFSKEIFVVTRKVLSSLNEDGGTTHLSIHALPNTTPNKTEQLLDAIDEITLALQQVVPHQIAQKRTLLSHHQAAPLDLKSEVSTDEIALRFYYIQRLQKAMDLLKKSSNHESYFTLNYHGFSKSPGIATTLRAMQETNSAGPMTHQWDDLKEYKFIDNLKFVKEFVSVAFIALRHIYTNPGESPFGAAHLESMSIDQILHAIDIITDQVSNSSQAYNNRENETFQEWLQQYWWSVPLTIGIIAVRLAYYYHQSMHSPYGYFSGSFGGSSHHGTQSSSQSLNFL